MIPIFSSRVSIVSEAAPNYSPIEQERMNLNSGGRFFFPIPRRKLQNESSFWLVKEMESIENFPYFSVQECSEAMIHDSSSKRPKEYNVDYLT